MINSEIAAYNEILTYQCLSVQVLMWESVTTSVNVTYSYTTSDGILYLPDSVQQKT